MGNKSPLVVTFLVLALAAIAGRSKNPTYASPTAVTSTDPHNYPNLA